MECYEEVQRQLTANRMERAAKTGLAAATALCLVLCGTEALGGGLDAGLAEMEEIAGEADAVGACLTGAGKGILDIRGSEELKGLLASAGEAAVIPESLSSVPGAAVPGVPDTTDTPVITVAPGKTDAPVITDVPSTADTPVITVVPGKADAPVITDVPSTADTPVITVVPDKTDAPVMTDMPDKNGENVPAYAVVEGFFVDDAGMIRGIASPETAVSDGYMELPSTGCTGIARGAFLEVPKGIVEVYIPANIVNVEAGAFLGLTDAEWFEADPGNEAIMCAEGILYTDGGECLLAFPSGRVGTFLVPEGTARFAQDAFAESRLDKLDMRSGRMSDTGNIPESILLVS